jgi:predicted CxxxxCH...CXXCH cytochrome family protein
MTHHRTTVPGTGSKLGAAILGLALATLAACDLGTKPTAGDGGPPVPTATTSCASSCHGSGPDPSPPRDLGGNSDTSVIGVGAHRKHLQASTWHGQFACAMCHDVPREIGAPGHITLADGVTPDTDGIAEVIFTGTLATGAHWDRNGDSGGGTCTNNYCHGATLTNQFNPTDPPANAGGRVTVPVWTIVDGSQTKCDSCHGNPPPAPHPVGADCSKCHNTMKPGANPDANSFLYPETHIDGKVDATSPPCDSCHGGAGLSYPPKAVNGNTATTERGVGAHAKHMNGDLTWHAQIVCEQCHHVPTSINDPLHIMVDPANPSHYLPEPLVWGDGTNGTVTSGKNPQWDGTRCSNTYCHGSAADFVTGGTITTPVWTQVDGTQTKPCTACHGMPPTDKTRLGTLHPNDTNCGTCHTDVASGNNPTTFLQPALHINGKIESNLDMPCTNCHGSTSNPAASTNAPPNDTKGGATVDQRGVGAHQAHLVSPEFVPWRTDIACDACHPSATMPTKGGVSTATHPDSTIQVVFNTGANAIAGNAVWNPTTLQCGDSYCHGNGGGILAPSHPNQNAGGNAHNPVWNSTAVGAYTQCDSCHGNPPPLPHPAEPDPNNPNCGKCHASMTDGMRLGIITNPALHINGSLEVSTDQPCNSCHGDATVPAANLIPGDPRNAPPIDIGKNTSTAFRGIGAHQLHMATNNWSKPVACSDCHMVPTSVDAVGHNDTTLPAEVIFSAIVSASGSPAADWNGSTCTNTTCHGSTLRNPKATGTPGSAGGTTHNPVWTGPLDGSQVKCNSCHGTAADPSGLPPPPHSTDGACDKCHTDMSSATVFSMPAQHVDGTVQINSNLPCNGCHGNAAAAPVAAPGNASAAPPVAVAVGLTPGGTATTLLGVGAHQAHLIVNSTWHVDFTCVNCHTQVNDAGQAGHNDHPLPATMVFTGVGAGTTFDGASSCTSYCHGSTLKEGTVPSGGTATTPIWTKVDGSQSKCNSCHGNPPVAPHSQTTTCEDCHGDVILNAAAGTWKDRTKHIDGIVQSSGAHPVTVPPYSDVTKHGYDFDNTGLTGKVTANNTLGQSCATASCHGTALTGAGSAPSCDKAGCHTTATGKTWRNDCTFCHGVAGGNGAPPAGIFGATAVTDPTVGSHTKHVTANATMHNAWDCVACHTKPTDALSAGHVEGGVVGGPTVTAAAELLFAAPNTSATWNATTSTCTNAYCHSSGAATPKYVNPVWTSTTAMTCTGSCHVKTTNGAITKNMTNEHTSDHSQAPCQDCHNGVATASASISNLTLHFNGTITTAFNLTNTTDFTGGTFTWNASAKTCTGTCHSGGNSKNHQAEKWK